jgi:hypothetical protein
MVDTFPESAEWVSWGLFDIRIRGRDECIMESWITYCLEVFHFSGAKHREWENDP